MFRTLLNTEGMLQSSALKKVESPKRKIVLLWPISPVTLALLFPLLPTSLYLNKGYTTWYHIITIAYLLTQKESIRRFLIVQGFGVSVGWYGAMVNELYHHGRFAHILYMNVPPFMKAEMVDAAGRVFYTQESLIYMLISHVLDILLHPGIAYLMYKGHRKSGRRVDNIITWNIVLSAFAVSRLWSAVHTLYNQGILRGWYFGHDVYHFHDLSPYMAAYVAEGIFFAGIAVYKLSKHGKTRLFQSV